MQSQQPSSDKLITLSEILAMQSDQWTRIYAWASSSDPNQDTEGWAKLYGGPSESFGVVFERDPSIYVPEFAVSELEDGDEPDSTEFYMRAWDQAWTLSVALPENSGQPVVSEVDIQRERVAELEKLLTAGRKRLGELEAASGS